MYFLLCFVRMWKWPHSVQQQNSCISVWAVWAVEFAPGPLFFKAFHPRWKPKNGFLYPEEPVTVKTFAGRQKLIAGILFVATGEATIEQYDTSTNTVQLKADSHLPCHAHAMFRPCRSSQGHSTARPSRDGLLCCGLEKNGMVGAWHGHGMASVNQTRLQCINQMGKTHSKPLAVQHGRSTVWARHGHGRLCVNRPL